MAEKTKVLVGILAGSGEVHASLAQLAFTLPVAAAHPDHPYLYALHIEDGVRPQEFARNVICGAFLKGGGDILVMIDNDMIANVSAIAALLSTPDYDIAAPMEFMWWPLDVGQQPPRMPQCYAVAGMFDREHPNKIQPMTPMPGANVSDVDWVGSGCVAIKRHVLEDQRMQLARNSDPPALWRNLYEPNFERVSGLDIDFCRRAKRAGFKIRVNWGAEVGHWKHVDLNQVEMYRQLAFQRGVEIGEKRHESSLAHEQDRPDQGSDGVARPAQPGDGAVASVGVGGADPGTGAGVRGLAVVRP